MKARNSQVVILCLHLIHGIFIFQTTASSFLVPAPGNKPPCQKHSGGRRLSRLESMPRSRLRARAATSTATLAVFSRPQTEVVRTMSILLHSSATTNDDMNIDTRGSDSYRRSSNTPRNRKNGGRDNKRKNRHQNDPINDGKKSKNNTTKKRRHQQQQEYQYQLQQNQMKRRHSKQELNDLVRNIGLTPVTSTKKTQQFDSNTTNKNNDQQHHEEDVLQSTKNISTEIQLQYARNGHAVLRSTIPKPILRQVKNELLRYSKGEELKAWRQKVEVLTKSVDLATSCSSIQECKSILSQQQQQQNASDLQIPFLQHFNTWRKCPSVTKLVTSPYLSHIASQLLDVPYIRLYQDSLFHKRSGDGPTPWHSDARMAPFDTSSMITFWIPLDDIPPVEDGGTGLWFVDKSHVDFALPFWNPVPKCDDVGAGAGAGDGPNSGDDPDDIYERLEERYGGEDSIKHYMPIDVGDFTVHAGWTLHSANGGPTMIDEDDNMHNNSNMGMDRYALAITYVDAKAEVRRDAQRRSHGDSKDDSYLGHDEDRESYRDWIDEVSPRQYFEHHLVPIVWPPSEP